MPNYNLVANTQFKARSFDDMIRPYVMYTQEYRAQEDAIADLATKADVWAGLANEQTDPVAYAQYINYANALKDQAAVIADRGLSPSSRQAMLNLKRRYSSEIVPIEQAYTARKAQAEEQRKALLQNPTLMMSRRADTTSLDRYMENPNLGYESYSGALLTQQAGQAAAAIAKELRDYGKGKPLDGFTRTWLQQHGYTAGEVAFAINHPDDPRASSVLNTIVNNVMADSGMADWADNKTLNQAYNYARQGLWQAVGQTQVGTYTDQAAVMAAQEAMQKRAEVRAANRAKEIEKEKIKKERLRGVNPTSLYTVSEKNNFSNAQKNIDNWVKKGYLGKKLDGSIYVTKKGLNHANEVSNIVGYNSHTSKWADPSFRNFLKEVGAVDDKQAKTQWIGSASASWSQGNEQYQLKGWSPDKMNKYMTKLQGGYDTDKETEFVHDYGSSEEQGRAKNMIRRAVGNSNIQVVSYKGPTDGYTYDKDIDKKDFVDNYTVLASKGSKYGQVFVVEDKEGKKYDIRVPEVHREHQASTSRYYISAEDAYKNIVALEPQFKAAMGRVNSGTSWENLTEQERKVITDYYSYSDTYEDILWKAESEQGNITRGYKTDNLETE